MSTAIVPLAEYLSTVYEADCDYVDGVVEERNAGERTHSWTMSLVASDLLTRYAPSGREVLIALRVQVSPTRIRVPDICLTLSDPGEEILTNPPYLCIEIIAPEDRVTRLAVRIQDYLSMGVPNVWVIDPVTRQAYTATPEQGLREVK